jgi:two-component system invasion response regulator UvrY
MIRLFIADDHPMLREGLTHVVSRDHDIEVVGEAADADETIQGCTATAPDVILLDVSMPGPGILELIARLKNLRPTLRILVLSVHPERYYAKRVLKAGADGYLTKNNSSQSLATAIRQVDAGKKYISPWLAQELAWDLSNERPAHEKLANREYQVFVQLGCGRSISTIAKLLRLSPKTVRVYRSRILEKMNLRTTAELIFYAVQRDLVTDVIEDLHTEDDAVTQKNARSIRGGPRPLNGRKGGG